MYKRSEYQTIKSRLEEPRKFIQVVMGAKWILENYFENSIIQNRKKGGHNVHPNILIMYKQVFYFKNFFPFMI